VCSLCGVRKALSTEKMRSRRRLIEGVPVLTYKI
jgi:hypothetical protein